MKKILIILVFFSSCNSQEFENNRVLQQKIDKLGFSECQLNLEIDSLRNIIDTIGITKKKLDQNGKLVFKKEEYISNGISFFVETYFWEDGTSFLSIKGYESEDFKNYLEVFRNKKKEIKRKISFNEVDGVRKDSLIMDLHYEYSDSGKKKRLTSAFEDNSKEAAGVHILNYNEDERVKSEFAIMEADTFERKTYFYLNKKLVKIERYNHFYDTLEVVQFFNGLEKNDSTITSLIKDGIKKVESKKKYIYDEDSTYTGYEIFDTDNGVIRKIAVINKTCD